MTTADGEQPWRVERVARARRAHHASRAVARAEGDGERFRPRDGTVPMTSDPGGERRQRCEHEKSRLGPGGGQRHEGRDEREDDRRDGLDAEE